VCGFYLTDITAEPVERLQVFDIEPKNYTYMDIKREIKQCLCCQNHNKASYPDGVSQAVQYEGQFQGMTVYLSRIIWCHNNAYSNS